MSTEFRLYGILPKFLTSKLSLELALNSAEFRKKEIHGIPQYSTFGIPNVLILLRCAPKDHTGAMEAHPGAVDDNPGAMKAQPGAEGGSSWSCRGSQ